MARGRHRAMSAVYAGIIPMVFGVIGWLVLVFDMFGNTGMRFLDNVTLIILLVVYGGMTTLLVARNKRFVPSNTTIANKPSHEELLDDQF